MNPMINPDVIIFHWDESYATPPPQCPAKRSPTLWERLRAAFGLFDVGFETRCHRYQGHEAFGYKHECIHRREWE